MRVARPKISAVILAAGQATRFGSDKRRARLSSGMSVLETTVGRYLDADLPSVVVLDRSDAAWQRVFEAWPVDIVTLAGARSGRHEVGMGDSLAAGVSHISRRGDDGCLVALADMPAIQSSTVRALADLLRRLLQHPADSGAIVAPVWSDGCSGTVRGHPVGFGVRYFAELSELRGDRGARGVVQRHRQRLVECPVNDPGVVMDIDTPRDLRPQQSNSTDLN